MNETIPAKEGYIPFRGHKVWYRIPGSEWVIFEHSSHMPHAEEPERYMHVLDGFLSRVETTAR